MSDEIKHTPPFDVKPLPLQKGYVDPDTGKFIAETARCITFDDWLQAQNIIAALKQRVAELEREQSALTKMAREAIPDYPFDPKHPLPLREAVYGLTQALEGTTLACGDLWKELEAARKVASCLHDFATAHEKWEAALIMDDAAWQGGMAAWPTLNETLYAGMMELQRQRAAALVTYDLAAYRATQTKEPRDDE